MNAAAKNQTRRLPLDKYPARLRPDQVAAYLNCSEDHVLKLIRRGALQAVNMAALGSSKSFYRISRKALASFVKTRKDA